MRHGEVDPAQRLTPRPEDLHPDAPEAEMARHAPPEAPRDEGRLAGFARWQEIKTRFVDDPPGAIAAAEELVRQAVEDKIRRLKEEQEELRAAGADEDGSSTEGLRMRLIRYQAYCESLSSGKTAH